MDLLLLLGQFASFGVYCCFESGHSVRLSPGALSKA